MTKRKLYGSVSHGTMRPADLIPRFIETLEYFNKRKAKKLTSAIPSDAWSNDTHEFWRSEPAMWLLEDLFDVLNDYAPAKHYFGSHPGDGSDYGFWPCEDV